MRYESRFAWVAMVLVDPAVRGQGIGTQLVREALAVLTDVPCVRLDATPAGQRVYRQLEFRDEYGLSRMVRPITADQMLPPHHGARRMTPEDIPAVLSLDREVFGADRRALLEWEMAGAPEYAWVYEAQGRITGYVLGRHGFNAEHVGPVIAQDQDVAQALVSACLERLAGKPCIVDATRHDPVWYRLLESLGFREQRPFLRMFRGAAPSYGVPARQFAVMGPEFG